MKLLFLFALVTSSLFAQSPGLSQSYILLDTGETMTVRSYFPDEGYIKLFKPDGIFLDFETLEVKKNNYFIDEDENIYTVSSDGYMLTHPGFEADSNIKIYGESFFVSRKGSVYIIKNDGSLIENSHEKREKKLKVKVAGGNYLITNKNEVVLVNNENGELYFTGQEVKAKEVKITGNNYFTLEDGTLFTTGFTKNNDGTYQEYLTKFTTGIGNKIQFAGGNFFIDHRNFIHTVSLTGYYNAGNPSRKLRVTVSLDGVDRSLKKPTHIGGNYFIYDDGAVYFVDFNGEFYHLDTIAPRIDRTNK